MVKIKVNFELCAGLTCVLLIIYLCDLPVLWCLKDLCYGLTCLLGLQLNFVVLTPDAKGLTMCSGINVIFVNCYYV